MLLEFTRASLIFVHLLLFAGVLSLVVWSDFAILKKGVHATPFKLIAEITITLLTLLWITGLVIIYIDTQFDIQILLQKPKLILKLLCVSVLSLNGVILHTICFKHLVSLGRLQRRNAIVISVCGAISSSNWFLAAFVGSASMLNQFSLVILLMMYLAVMLMAIIIAISISGLIQSRINQLRATERLRERLVELTERIEPTENIGHNVENIGHRVENIVHRAENSGGYRTATN